MNRPLLDTAIRIADTIMQDHPGLIAAKWQYDVGLLLTGFWRLSEVTGDPKYYEYLETYYDYFILPDGTIRDYNLQEKNVDHLNCGKNLFPLYEKTGEERFLTAIRHLGEQLTIQPRTQSGSFWHKQIYPNQIWLDGLYMAQPFYGAYAGYFREEADYEDILCQFRVAREKTYDPRSGLYTHACDESRTAFWADPATGRSLNIWGRAVGWYSMALVDTLDHIPAHREDIRKELISHLQELMAGVVRYQDPQGVWYQVLDSRRNDNYQESTCTCQFAYTLEKGIRMGYLDAGTFRPSLQKAVEGILQVFLRQDGNRTCMGRGCAVAGLGPQDNTRRNGTLDYYFSEPVRDNDYKGVGPFLLLAAAYEGGIHKRQ